MKICFFGSDEFSLHPLEALCEAGYEIACIITKPDAKKGRGHFESSTIIADFAEKRHIPVLKPKNLKEDSFRKNLKLFQLELGIVCSYGKILPKTILDVPDNGCINVHPSLLPKYRGATPVESALINGEETTGVTIFQMNEACDAGDIILQKEFIIKPDDDRQTLKQSLSYFAAEVLLQAVALIKEKTAQPTPQDDSKATYTRLIKKEDLQIDWTSTSRDIINQTRAFWPVPGARTTFRGKTIAIAPMSEISSTTEYAPGTIVKCVKNQGVCVASGDGILMLSEIKPEGKKIMTSWQFACGCMPKPGEKLGK